MFSEAPLINNVIHKGSSVVMFRLLHELGRTKAGANTLHISQTHNQTILNTLFSQLKPEPYIKFCKERKKYKSGVSYS